MSYIQEGYASYETDRFEQGLACIDKYRESSHRIILHSESTQGLL